MPKQTFYNLPDSKKNTIVEVAIDEFASYDFNDASINRIVEKANIAKGSFYQYFQDKLDLYKYVMDYITTKKLEYFSDLIKFAASKDFFVFLKELFDAGMAFAVENPKFCAISDRLYKNAVLRQEILGEMETKSHAYMKNLIIQGQAAGSIREDINLDLVTYFLYSMNLSLGELYYKSHKTWHYDATFKELTNDIIDILKNGIKKQ